MAFSISIQADQNSPVLAILSRLIEFDQRKADLFDKIGSYGVQSTQDRFHYQHDVEGNPWKVSWRADKNKDQTGRDHGDLMNGLNYQLIPNGVEWGANVEYAHVFHFGAKIIPKRAKFLVFKGTNGQTIFAKEVNIPSRSFLGINADDEQEILNIIEKHIYG